MGPILGAIVFALNKFVFGTEVILPGDVDAVSVSGSAIVEQGAVLWTVATAAYGRWRASKKVTSII
jgi:hypothetical protein